MPELTRALEDKGTRSYAARAMGQIGKDALPALTKAAGHKNATAPKQAGAGPAMTRSAGGPKTAPRPGGSREAPKGVAKAGNDGPKPKVGGGPATK